MKQVTGNKRVFTIKLKDIVKIAYKIDVDIIYTLDKFIICEKNSINIFDNIVTFIYASKKEGAK